MERKESAHGLQLIHYGAIALKGRFSQLFMGTFAMVTPLALMVLIPAILAMLLGYGFIFSIGVVLFAIFVGPMQVGYIKFFNMTLNGEQPKISVIYSQLKFNVKTLRCIYIALLLFLMYILGGILWLVPAGFAISFFSMVLFFLEKYDYGKIVENYCTEKNKQLNVFPQILVGNDRTHRAGRNAIIYDRQTPENFYKGAKKAIDIVQQKDEDHRIIFLNSWNEWGEGAYMEPDLKFGTGYLEALKEAISEIF